MILFRLRAPSTRSTQQSYNYPVPFQPTGLYGVYMSYVSSANRASNVAVTVTDDDGEHALLVDERDPPSEASSGFHRLGQFRFGLLSSVPTVVISNEATDDKVGETLNRDRLDCLCFDARAGCI